MTVTIKKKLTQREQSILLYVYENRVVTKKQIYQIYFEYIPTGQAICRNILNKLSTYRYLKRDTNKFYTLDKAGLEFIRQYLGIIELKPQIKPTAHLIETNNFKNALIVACRNNKTLFLKDFKSYYNHKELLEDRAIFIHVPDAMFLLQKEQKHYLLFLEIDRGTENSGKYLRMIRWYINYFSGGYFRKTYKGFNVAFCLIVVPNDDRMKHMRQKATEIVDRRQIEIIDNLKDIDLCKHYLKYLWITTKDNIKPEWIFTKVWKSLDINDEVNYGIT